MKFSIAQLLWLTALVSIVFGTWKMISAIVPGFSLYNVLMLLALPLMIFIGFVCVGGITNFYVRCGACDGEGRVHLTYAEKECPRCKGTGNSNSDEAKGVK